MTTLQALIIAILQGVTELFPVSSLGHAVIIPAILHWSIDQRSPAFLPFLVTLHLGTAIALLAYFWRDWYELARGALGQGDPAMQRESRHILWLIILATLPAVVLGFLFESFLRRLFGTPEIAAIFLVVNGIMLLAGEKLRGRSVSANHRPIATLDWRDALVIGLWQCLAFIPGISRSGAAIIGGILRGIDHQGAARFSFLIATPIIFAATADQMLHLHKAGAAASSNWAPAILAAVVAGITALASTAFLMRYFRSHEDWAMSPFAIYCILFGAASFAFLYL
ncbi:undecaprenyl-diphosphate phosphatase [Lichenicoccus roseus]|uniref:Undecaprenyl-diphosphatase n=1 Tax=Lichenicoccus roseus TaxID=2683649 RepID=A0A5R9JAP2_9PROT|nr:undecaprenyl-diphosphate phosphatase [Lichenicoccus roseus]TLU72671.1 undecaprenyl-diphosphate phosphatase [Lichenicoccus roseus]